MENTDVLSSILKKIDSDLFQRQNWEQSLSDFTLNLERVREDKQRLEAAIVLNTKAQALLQILFEKLNEKGISKLVELLTIGLNQVFPSRNYEVVYEVVPERGSNSLYFFLKEKLSDGKIITSNIRNATGGSIRAIVGLICTLFYISKVGGRHFIVLDEALSQIDDKSVDDLFQMLKSFGKDAGFSYLLITHDVRFLDHGDRIYMVESGTVKRVK